MSWTGAPAPAALPGAGQPQVPILCARCMGPARPLGDGDLQCDYCGLRDWLPADQLARALEVRRRLDAARASVANLQGMDSALAEIFESRRAFWRVSGIYVVAGVLLTLNSVWSALPHLRSAPPHLRATLTIDALLGGVWLGGLALALLVGSLIGRRRFRRHVRPHLLARLPAAPGAPARCRACGADLPDSREPFVSCPYCTTRSLVTPELATNRRELLERERAFHAARAGQALGGMRGVSLHLSRVFLVAMVAAYGLMLGLSALASYLATP